MTDDRERIEDESTAERTCPSCGERIKGGVVLGPSTAYAGPCGCRVAPETVTGAALEDE